MQCSTQYEGADPKLSLVNSKMSLIQILTVYRRVLLLIVPSLTVIYLFLRCSEDNIWYNGRITFYATVLGVPCCKVACSRADALALTMTAVAVAAEVVSNEAVVNTVVCQYVSVHFGRDVGFSLARNRHDSLTYLDGRVNLQ